MKKKISLENITLLCYDGRVESHERTERYKKILNFCTTNISFFKIKMFLTFDFKFNGVDVIRINKTSISNYSKFCISHLNNEISSDFCLLFQDDGFILNPNLWDDEFFNYDYIGAPWPLYIGWPQEGDQVGNGGFSLRSKKFLQSCAKMTPSYENEDTYILFKNRPQLNSDRIKIAPLEVARKFSVEIPLDKDHKLENTFGFHSKSNLDSAIKYIEKKTYEKD